MSIFHEKKLGMWDLHHKMAHRRLPSKDFADIIALLEQAI